MSDIIPIPDTDDELLQECAVETFRSGGKGGQHVDKVETGVRLRHRPSGIVVTSRAQRSQYLNKLTALHALRRRLEKHNERRAPRVPTKVPRAARRKSREAKQRQALKKRLRSKPGSDGD